jgi:hypothetical protein
MCATDWPSPALRSVSSTSASDCGGFFSRSTCVTEALVEDLIGPSCTHDAGAGDSDQQIAQRCGIQHARVVHDGECHIPSVSHPVFLRDRGEFVECSRLPLRVCLTIRKQIIESHAPMRADFPERDLAALQQVYQERP